MGLLDQQMQDDQLAFLNSDEFGESVTFYPYGGTSRTITVIVNRDAPPTQDEFDSNLREVMLVSIANHATRGVTSSSYSSRDEIALSFRPGETAKRYLLGMPVSIDAAMLHFRIK